MKKYKLIILFALIYFAIVMFILFISSINDVQIVLYPNISIKYDNKEYKKNDFNSKLKYNIYVDNKYVANSSLSMDEYSTYLNNEVLTNFIAISNKKIKLVDYKIDELPKEEYMNVLNELEISKYGDMNLNKKILVDYDKDGVIEEINVISNLFVDPFMDDIGDDKFSIVYTIDDGKKNVIYNKKFSEDIKGCLISTPYVIDINKDKKYELVTTCTYFDKLGTSVQIFELKKEGYKLIKEL